VEHARQRHGLSQYNAGKAGTAITTRRTSTGGANANPALTFQITTALATLHSHWDQRRATFPQAIKQEPPAVTRALGQTTTASAIAATAMDLRRLLQA